METRKGYELLRPIELLFYTVKIYCDNFLILKADHYYFDIERINPIYLKKLDELIKTFPEKYKSLVGVTPEKLMDKRKIEYLPLPTLLPLFNNDNIREAGINENYLDKNYPNGFKLFYIKEICWDGYSWRYKLGNSTNFGWILEGDLIPFNIGTNQTTDLDFAEVAGVIWKSFKKEGEIIHVNKKGKIIKNK